MISMTGFGYGEFQDDALHLTLDLKSFNHRYLDLILNIPVVLNPLEPKIREFLNARISRGRVELYLRSRILEEAMEVYIDRNVALSFQKGINELSDILGLKDKAGLNQILQMEGVIKTDRKNNLDQLWEKLQTLLHEVYEQYQKSRIIEGSNTETDITNQIDIIESELAEIKKRAPEAEADIKRILHDKFQDVLGQELDERRILTETAVYLVKYDINEEIVRLSSQLGSFSSMMQQSGALGKKLDFTCQEMNREVNTIGSKSQILEVHQSVVVMKDSLEKIREQLRNVE